MSKHKHGLNVWTEPLNWFLSPPAGERLKHTLTHNHMREVRGRNEICSEQKCDLIRKLNLQYLRAQIHHHMVI